MYLITRSIKVMRRAAALTALACACCLTPQFALAQKAKTTTYVVQPGETLLGIAHRHGTTLDHMLSLNPGMNPDYVQAGQKLVVPAGKAEPYVAPTKQTTPAAKPATQTAKPVAPQAVQPAVAVTQAQVGQQPQPRYVTTYRNYTVKRKDTAYSLAKANGITVDELMEANPDMRQAGYKLKKGTTLRIPVKQLAPEPTYHGLSTIRLAVVLPFSGSGLENERSVEFYRGVLMGIEDLKQSGLNVTVTAWDEPAPDMSVAAVMTEVRLSEPDVVLGPLYPTHFNDVTAAAGKMTRVVVPFSSKVPQVDYRSDVYVINTPASYEGEVQENLFVQAFGKNATIVMLHSAAGDKRALCESLQQRLYKEGCQVVSAPLSSHAAQIVTALSGKGAKRVVLMPDNSSEDTFNMLRSTEAELRRMLPGVEISLVGYEPLIALSEGSGRQALHDADAYVFASNYYYPHTAAAQAFASRYRQWFKADLLDSKPRMAPLGYDFSRTFLANMATYGYDYTTQPAREGTLAAQGKLQTDLKFLAVKGGGYVNRSMWLIHFKRDMSIVKLSAY